MKTYEFNPHGVCVNAETLEVKGKGQYDFAEIRLALRPQGGWVYGYSWQCDHSGSAYPIRKQSVGFASMEAAQSWAVHSLKLSIDTRCKGADHLIDTINNTFVKKQLSLF